MAKKPIKKAAKKPVAKKKVVKKATKKAVKPAPKPTKPVKKVAKKVVKKVVAKKKTTKVSVNPLTVSKKGELKGLPAPKAALKPVVKGRIPEVVKKSVAPSIATMKFDKEGWDKMSGSQKRVFIVTNCIKFMEHGLKVAKGDYIKSPSLDNSMSKIDSWRPSDLKDMLGNAADVTVCGAGILLYADIMLRGEYGVYKNNKLGNIGLSDISKRLDYFNVEQLKIIESSFETKWAFSMDDKSHMPAIQFGMKITDDKRRMAAILQNIISNDGNFHP